MTFDAARVQAVLFDVDGTLADTDDEYIRRAAGYLRALHFLFPQRDPTRFLRWSLMAAETPLNRLMSVPDRLGLDAPLARLWEWAAARRGRPASHGHFVLMEGVRPMLARLAARYPLALVTARGRRSAEGFVAQFQLAPYFRCVVSALTAPRAKPYPHPVLWAARALDVPVEHCLMVGDTTVDVAAGRRAGAQTVGVLCGFGQRAELERSGASLILPHTALLADALLGPAPGAAPAARAGWRPAPQGPTA